MKKSFLSAAALSLVMVSCSTDDNVNPQMLQGEKFGESQEALAYRIKIRRGLADVIAELRYNCQDIEAQGNMRIMAVTAQAMQMPSFLVLVDARYRMPTTAEMDLLAGSPTELIQQMKYRTAVKNELTAMLINGETAQSYEGNTTFSISEQELLETCRALVDDGGGGLGSIGGARPLAFAIGYQTSRAKAVLMAVLADK